LCKLGISLKHVTSTLVNVGISYRTLRMFQNFVHTQNVPAYTLGISNTIAEGVLCTRSRTLHECYSHTFHGLKMQLGDGKAYT
jgi:hypothetical protein